MKRLAFVLALLVLAVVSRGASAEGDPVRVAVLMPFVEDALRQAQGARFTLVAAVRRDLHTPAAEGVVDLGNPHSPNFERLAEARPDLVIGDRQIHGLLAPRLEASGAQVMLIDTTTTRGTLDALVEVGRRVHAGPALEAAVSNAREQLTALRLAEPRKVLALFGTPGRFYVVNQRSWLGDLLAELGYENVAPEGQEQMPGLVVVSDEAVALLDPDLVLVVAHGDPRKIEADVDRRARAGGSWASLGDAALGIHVLDPRLFSAQPGLALPEAAAALVGYAAPPVAAEGR